MLFFVEGGVNFKYPQSRMRNVALVVGTIIMIGVSEYQYYQMMSDYRDRERRNAERADELYKKYVKPHHVKSEGLLNFPATKFIPGVSVPPYDFFVMTRNCLRFKSL